MNNRLKKLITVLGITQSEFANSIGVKSAYISDIISGRTKGFSVEMLNNIYSEYSVNINWLLTGEGEMFLSKKSTNSINVVGDNNNISGNILSVSSEERELLEQLRKKKNKKILDAIKVLLGAGILFGLFWLAR